MNEIQVLIVEDDPLFQVEVEMLLEELHYTGFETVNNGREALERLEAKNFDLLLLDIGIRGSMNGIELAEKVSDQRIPFLFFTASDDPQVYEQARELRPSAFLIKPFHKITLRSAIESALMGSEDAAARQQAVRFIQEEKRARQVLFVRSNNKLFKVNLEDIGLIEGEGNYCEIITPDRRVAVKTSLKQILQKLPPQRFIRVHRNFAVHIVHIDNVDLSDNSVSIYGMQAPIGGTFRAAFVEQLNLL